MHIDDPSAEQLLSRPLKLAFFDIDGTLLGLDGDYSARLARAISALQKAGVKTAVASGRPKFAADFLIDELGLEAAGLYCTGAHIENPLDEEGVIALHSLSAALVSQLLVAATELGLYTCPLYTADAADDMQWFDLGGRSIHKTNTWRGGSRGTGR